MSGQKESGDIDQNSTLKKIIKELEETSRFQRHESNDGGFLLQSADGRKFPLKRILDPSDLSVFQAWQLLKDTFQGYEIVPFDLFKTNVLDANSFFFVVLDENNKILALSWVDYLELSKPSLSREAILFVNYIVTKESHRHLGFARELYRISYERAADLAGKSGQKIRAVIGETKSSAEKFLNRLERKRIYFEGQDGNLHEVPYIQPPLIFDHYSGRPASLSLSQHLMIRLVDGKKTLDVQDLLAIVGAIYDDYLPPKSFFNSLIAYNICRYWIRKELRILKEKLSGAINKKTILLSFSQRQKKLEELQKKGLKIFEIPD